MELHPQPDFNASTGLLMGGCSLALAFDAPALTAAMCRATAVDSIAVDDEITVTGHCRYFDGGTINIRHGSRVVGTIGEAGDFECSFTANSTSAHLTFVVEPNALATRHVITLSNWTRP